MPGHGDLSVNLREWVQEEFGTTGAELLDPEAYGLEELRIDALKLEVQAEQLEREMDEHRESYRSLLEQGAEAKEGERRAFATKAKFEKKKFAVKRKQHRATLHKLATVRTIEAARELVNEMDNGGESLELSDVADEVGTKLEKHVVERLAHVDIEPSELKQVADALNVPAFQEEFGTDTSEELHLMEDMTAGSLEPADVDPASLGPATGPEFGSLGNSGSPEIDGIGANEPTELGSDLTTEGSVVEPHVDSVSEHDLVEASFERDDQILAGVTIHERGYAAHWTQPAAVGDLLDWVAGDDRVPSNPRAEASFQGNDDEQLERVTGPLSDIRTDDRFPERCRFLAVAGDGFEVSWEDDPGVNGAEVALNVTDGSAKEFKRFYRKAREGELSMEEFAAVFGRTEELFEEYL